MKRNWKTALKAKQRIYNVVTAKIPAELAEKSKVLHSIDLEILRQYLVDHYFSKTISADPTVVAEYLAGEEGQFDLSNQLIDRLSGFRTNIIPWLNNARPLAGARILEIGCGTGSSTVALAEQGAHVVAVDVDEASLKVAEQRCALYGVNADIYFSNAVDVHTRFANEKFDFIIYFACLEHMTHEERMSAMATTWDMLDEGDMWCVIETPNRIWFDDHHTAKMPFFMWLPDDLAFKYAKLSPRKSLNSAYSDYSDDNFLHFLRAGRGVSFHEFDLTMGSAQTLDVVSSLASYTQSRSKIWSYGRRLVRSRNARYEAFLKKVCPEIHSGFMNASLDLIIQKH